MVTIGVRTTAPRKGANLFKPFCQLELTHYAIENRVRLTPQLMTDSEIDYEVKGLIEQLQQVGKKAKRDLKTANERVLADVRERL